MDSSARPLSVSRCGKSDNSQKPAAHQMQARVLILGWRRLADQSARMGSDTSSDSTPVCVTDAIKSHAASCRLGQREYIANSGVGCKREGEARRSVSLEVAIFGASEQRIEDSPLLSASAPVRTGPKRESQRGCCGVGPRNTASPSLTLFEVAFLELGSENDQGFAILFGLGSRPH